MARDSSLIHLPLELFEAWGIETLNLNPLSLSVAVGFASVDDDLTQLDFGVLFRVMPGTNWIRPWRDAGASEPESHPSGAQLFPLNDSAGNLFAVEFDDGTFAIGTQAAIANCLAGEQSSQLVELLFSQRQHGQLHAAVDVSQIRKPLESLIALFKPLQLELPDVDSLPRQVDTIQATLQLRGEVSLSLVLSAPDETSAQSSANSLAGLVDLGRVQIESQIADSIGRSEDLIANAATAYARRMLANLAQQVAPEVAADSVRMQITLSDPEVVIPMLTAVLLPAVEGARQAATEMNESNNAKQISLAVLNFESTFAQFPARYLASPEGTPLLSWRVMILPYLDEMELYNKFKLDEPWDSPHNLALAAEMPSVFRDRQVADPIKTCIVAATGPGVVFEAQEGIKFREIRDGASNTLMFVECDPDMAVVWTKPADLPFDPTNPVAGLSNQRNGGFLAAYCDGSVRTIPVSIDPAVLRRLFLRADGEFIPEF